jgi:hypothetical protein
MDRATSLAVCECRINAEVGRASRDHAENIAENRRFSKPEVQRVLRLSRGLKHAVASCFVDGCGHAFPATLPNTIDVLAIEPICDRDQRGNPSRPRGLAR